MKRRPVQVGDYGSVGELDLSRRNSRRPRARCNSTNGSIRCPNGFSLRNMTRSQKSKPAG
jgi:hypothetical protein